jgi:hypothetical protein
LGIASVALLTNAPEIKAQQPTAAGFIRVAARTQMELIRPTTGASKVLYHGPAGTYLDKQTAAPGLEFAAARETVPRTGVSLVVSDTTGALVRRIQAVQGYAWCGPRCLIVIRGTPDETEAGFARTDASVVADVRSNAQIPLQGPGIPTDARWASFDSSTYLKYPGPNGQVLVYRYQASTAAVTITSHHDFYFSPDGQYYLAFGTHPWDQPTVYSTQSDAPVNIPGLASLGFPVQWIADSGATLLVEKQHPLPPSEFVRNRGRPQVIFSKPGPPPEKDYYVYDVRSRSTLRSIHGAIMPWSSAQGLVSLMSGGRPHVLDAH